MRTCLFLADLLEQRVLLAVEAVAMRLLFEEGRDVEENEGPVAGLREVGEETVALLGCLGEGEVGRGEIKKVEDLVLGDLALDKEHFALDRRRQGWIVSISLIEVRREEG